MAPQAAAAPQWLQGLATEQDAYPDLFADIQTLIEPVADAEPVTTLPAIPWRPTRLVTPASWPTFTWAEWDDTVLADLGSLAGKFDANILALQTLQLLRSEQRTATACERRAMLRFTGWGGIPASFNLDGADPAWVERARCLRSLLSDPDYEAARASVNNAHYTPPAVVRWIWSMLQRFGFAGGAILEPSAGIGHFIGCMPQQVAHQSRITAIEIEPSSAAILKALYESAGVDVRAQPFETAALADASFDLVVSNVPFGKYKVSDGRNRPYSRFSIHNWFAGKALDLVRPGGLVCFITSTYLMDEWSSATRAYLASQAELVTSFRLPSGSFSRLASTAVQADLIVLKKRGSSRFGHDDGWLDLAPVPQGMRHPKSQSAYMQINQWFAAHPKHVLGLVAMQSNGYEAVPTTVLEGSLEHALKQSVETLPVAVHTPARSAGPSKPQEPVLAPNGARPGCFALNGGRVCRVEGTALIDVTDSMSVTQRLRVAGMCEIRDCARGLLEAQLLETSDSDLQDLRRALNASYDRFVAKHGSLSCRANTLAFRRDADYPLLLSLEQYDEEEATAIKADMFFKRTISRIEEATTADGPDEALALSMQWRGRVDAQYMAGLLDAEPAAVLDDLVARAMIFRDPTSDRYETADAYLSGNVKQKLHAAAAAGPDFAGNVAALEQVIPEDLPPSAIAARLGAVWIPAEVVEGFMEEVLQLQGVTVVFSATAGAWSVVTNRWATQRNVVCTQEYGTTRMDAVDLIRHALNVQTPTVRDPDPLKEGCYLVNKEQTLAAREKMGAIKDCFARWAFDEPARRERLCRIYNELFNCLRPREFNGAHLKLPGFSNCFELHPSQRNAIWRIVQSGNTGLFHAVGAGKTAIMVAASMEKRRLGVAHKPAHVVPNHMLHQYTAEFVRLYPCAKVLMASKHDLVGDRRREFVARIATGDWDAVVMTHSTFELLPMSSEFIGAHIRAIIRELELAVRSASNEERSNRIVKQLEQMKKSWKVRLERLENRERKDDFLWWEMLGIDDLSIDEAHLHKNLWRHTKMARVAGLPLANSQRAFDLYLKTRHTMALYDDAQRGVVLATATPVANSMAEIHTFQRYLQPKTLQRLGLEQFDAWAATFGETVTALEIAPDGSGYRLNTRFARFVNVPDLMTVFCDVSDIRTKEMLRLPEPDLKGGKPKIVTCKPSEALTAFVKTLVQRAERLRSERVDPRVDNMLNITNDGRKAALDMRLVGIGRADPNGKVAQCAAAVHAIWQSTVSLKRAQLVFCDLSTPKGGKAFSVYEELRETLIDYGIPCSEIAFIHDANSDAQKATLFRRVREGQVRVLVGSTQKMGIGTNVQKRLVALHELDCPWRPCDVEQREGRILRQGNECDEVEIVRYVTEGSFDAYCWQIVLTKAKFVTQVMSGDKGLRSIEDVELATLSYAEVKALASGNPKVIEKAGVDAEVAKYATLFSVWRDQRFRNESEVVNLPLRIQSAQNLLAALAADGVAANAVLEAGSVCISLRGQTYRDREEIGEAIRALIRTGRTNALGRSSEEKVGNVGAFQISLFIGRKREDVHLVLIGQTSHECGALQQRPALYSDLVQTLAGIEKEHVAIAERLTGMHHRLLALREELSKPFEHQERLTALLVRQRELNRELDLDRDELGTDGMAVTEERLAA